MTAVVTARMVRATSAVIMLVAITVGRDCLAS